MAHCPKCSSEDVHRSRTKNRWERWRKQITEKRPYRCRACRWRGWLPLQLSDYERAMVRKTATADPPNLRGTMLARSDPRHDLDLKKLDTFDLPHKDTA